MSYPKFEEIIAQRGEELFRVRRAFRSIFSHLIWFFVTTTIVVLLNIFLSNASGPLFSWFSPRWLAIIPVVVLLEIFRKHHDDIYVFERHGIVHYEGRLSLKSTMPAVKYLDILGISVEQDIFGRILDYGEILLDTAGESGVEIVISGVRAPSELAKLIDQLRAYSISRGGVSPSA